jgi:hypothetical protein
MSRSRSFDGVKLFVEPGLDQGIGADGSIATKNIVFREVL